MASSQGHLRFGPLDVAIVNIGQRLLEAVALPLVGLNFAIFNRADEAIDSFNQCTSSNSHELSSGVSGALNHLP